MSNLSLSLPSNNSWPFPCVPIAFTQGQLNSWHFCSSSSSCRTHYNTLSLLFTRLNKRSFFNLSLPVMSCRVLIILIVLCRDLSSPLAPLKLWSPKLGTTAQVWAQCHTEGSQCPWPVKYGTTQNWQLPEIPDGLVLPNERQWMSHWLSSNPVYIWHSTMKYDDIQICSIFYSKEMSSTLTVHFFLKLLKTHREGSAESYRYFCEK